MYAISQYREMAYIIKKEKPPCAKGTVMLRCDLSIKQKGIAYQNAMPISETYRWRALEDLNL